MDPIQPSNIPPQPQPVAPPVPPTPAPTPIPQPVAVPQPIVVPTPQPAPQQVTVNIQTQAPQPVAPQPIPAPQPVQPLVATVQVMPKAPSLKPQPEIRQPLQAPVSTSPLSTPRVSITPKSVEAFMEEPKHSHKGFWITLFFLTLLVAGGTYYYLYYYEGPYQYKPKTEVVVEDAPVVKPEVVWSDADLRLEYVKILASENAASVVLSSSSRKLFTIADTQYLEDTFRDATTTKAIDLKKAKAVIAAYPTAFSLVDEILTKKEYQCAAYLGDECDYATVQNLAQLVALRAYVSIKTGGDINLANAKNDILKVVGIGRRLVKGADDVTPLVLGSGIEKLGFNLRLLYIYGVTPKREFALDNAVTIKEELRTSFKKVLQYAYTRHALRVDYVNDPTKISETFTKFDPVASTTIEMYHSEIKEGNWDVVATKQLLYDSYKISIQNTSLTCDTSPTESRKPFAITQTTNPIKADEPNYVGKSFYTASYIPFDYINTSFCELDSLIDVKIVII